MESIIPDILNERKWKVRFLNSGGSSFDLGPRDKKEITIGLEPGEGFSSPDLEALRRQDSIDIVVRIDALPVGGKSYLIDSNIKISDSESIRLSGPLESEALKGDNKIRDVIGSVKLPYKNIKSVKLKSVTLNIEIEDI